MYRMRMNYLFVLILSLYEPFELKFQKLICTRFHFINVNDVTYITTQENMCTHSMYYTHISIEKIVENYRIMMNGKRNIIAFMISSLCSHSYSRFSTMIHTKQNKKNTTMYFIYSPPQLLFTHCNNAHIRAIFMVLFALMLPNHFPIEHNFYQQCVWMKTWSMCGEYLGAIS